MNYYEPWGYRLIDKKREASEVRDAEGDLIMRFDDPLAVPKPDLMNRIAACVNACTGMDDPGAEVARLKEWWQKSRCSE